MNDYIQIVELPRACGALIGIAIMIALVTKSYFKKKGSPIGFVALVTVIFLMLNPLMFIATFMRLVAVDYEGWSMIAGLLLLLMGCIVIGRFKEVIYAENTWKYLCEYLFSSILLSILGVIYLAIINFICKLLGGKD